MSHEYVGAIVLILGALAKMFGLEIENSAVEGLIAGIIALYIAIRRFKKGDITPLGARKF